MEKKAKPANRLEFFCQNASATQLRRYMAEKRISGKQGKAVVDAWYAKRKGK